MANFNNVPTIHAPRTRFNLSHKKLTSANVGDLVPFEVQEVYPGDTFVYDASFVARVTSAFIRPVVDDLFVDIYWFYVPSRTVYDKWEEIFGENKSGAWAQQTAVSAPTFQTTDASDLNIVSPGSVADYLGLPIDSGSSGSPVSILPNGINVLPFRCFAKIYDEWFRDENLIAPMQIYKGAYTFAGEGLNNQAWAPNNYTGKLPKVAKMHDPWTSALPSTQRGDAVGIPLSVGGYWLPLDRGELNTFSTPGAVNLVTSPGLVTGNYRNFGLAQNTATGGVPGLTYLGSESTGTGETISVSASNLGVTLPQNTNVSVIDLRYSFQLQRLLERSARSGGRYIEYLMSAFGVQSPDARLQRSEYLGGKRIPISMQQVAQTTRSTSSSDPEALGSLGAFSLTNGKAGFSKAFTEHGFIFGLLCIRQHHTYQQGIEQFWTRSNRFSYYDPIWAHLSEQPVYKDSIFAISNTIRDVNDTAFGYNEAWWDLRSRQNQITGQMRSDNPTSLDIWHFGDDYANAPTLNQQFIEETPDFVDRTLAVPSTSLDQFIFDIWMDEHATRRMPAYSIPGLIDHG